jgi:hypothetical protein
MDTLQAPTSFFFENKKEHHQFEGHDTRIFIIMRGNLDGSRIVSEGSNEKKFACSNWGSNAYNSDFDNIRRGGCPG